MPALVVLSSVRSNNMPALVVLSSVKTRLVISTPEGEGVRTLIMGIITSVTV